MIQISNEQRNALLAMLVHGRQAENSEGKYRLQIALAMLGEHCED